MRSNASLSRTADDVADGDSSASGRRHDMRAHLTHQSNAPC